MESNATATDECLKLLKQHPLGIDESTPDKLENFKEYVSRLYRINRESTHKVLERIALRPGLNNRSTAKALLTVVEVRDEEMSRLEALITYLEIENARLWEWLHDLDPRIKPPVEAGKDAKIRLVKG